MKQVTKFVVGMVVIVMAMLGLSACGSQPVAYTPTAAAFGSSGLSQCYMPLGVPQTAWQAIEQQYVAQHWCQPGWTPMYIPMSVYATYYPWYSSSGFYTHYIPVSYRTVYISSEKSWGTANSTMIKTLDRNAVYKGSNGKTTTYNKITSGGGSRTTNFSGSGTRCSPVRNALLLPKFQRKGGGGFSGGGSRGGSFSGGGSRSGSGSKSGSSTRSGC